MPLFAHFRLSIVLQGVDNGRLPLVVLLGELCMVCVRGAAQACAPCSGVAPARHTYGYRILHCAGGAESTPSPLRTLSARVHLGMGAPESGKSYPRDPYSGRMLYGRGGAKADQTKTTLLGRVAQEPSCAALETRVDTLRQLLSLCMRPLLYWVERPLLARYAAVAGIRICYCSGSSKYGVGRRTNKVG